MQKLYENYCHSSSEVNAVFPADEYFKHDQELNTVTAMAAI